MLIDYHTHHDRCGHAVGALEDYIKSAVERGMKQIGLSDHMPLIHVDPAAYYPQMAMPMDELPRYVEECLKLKEAYRGRIDVRVGLEGDYIAGYEEDVRKIVETYPWDYVIGSVHFLGTWDITDFRQVHEWESRAAIDVYRQYYGAIQAAAATGLYDYIGHIDVVKRFGFRPGPEHDDEVRALETAALEAVRKHGLAIEINTNGLHAEAKAMYPRQELLVQARRLGIPITFGSDAHKPERVGQFYELAEQALKEAGYTELAVFERRKRGSIRF